MMKLSSITVYFTSILLIVACNSSNNENATEVKKEDNHLSLKEAAINYTIDSDTMIGYMAYNESLRSKRPAVLVVHEWWGLDDYTKTRVRELVGIGYAAFAVDMYGRGKVANNPDEALKMALPNYKDPIMAKSRFDAALAKLKTYAIVDTNKIAAIGYCFGYDGAKCC